MWLDLIQLFLSLDWFWWQHAFPFILTNHPAYKQKHTKTHSHAFTIIELRCHISCHRIYGPWCWLNTHFKSLNNPKSFISKAPCRKMAVKNDIFIFTWLVCIYGCCSVYFNSDTVKKYMIKWKKNLLKPLMLHHKRYVCYACSRHLQKYDWICLLLLST